MRASQQISELIGAGMTQELIAEKADIYQSKVSRLFTETTKNPRWRDVESIRKLHQFVVVEKNNWDDFKTGEMTNIQDIEHA
ncbi:helix-turn-helix domain-containing protein [Psychrobacter sp. MES7-P7E]|uniref:helix-turn-helix domain-containing protein n=1 Tax=Psychrobacter sp. MES7-P7E TaxID=2058322 RepID=UPI000C7EA20B|nr:helix-turn-helix transcriptional regulator [Psychrobacter sp. MES7-P7E]PLT21120.1 hypothetical protein CXF62_11500 [Psychrobacter sp. MES7-P7E]|tara:strand:- start:313 stop:558 length:246 start_codon:yes stop_codon:yes gene_type:complete